MTTSIDSMDPGFDLAATRDNLLDWLLENGAVSQSEIPPPPSASLAEHERELAAWTRARDAAMVHANLHGVHAEEDGPDGERRPQLRCDEPSCKRAAVSYALHELGNYWAEQLPSEFAIGITHIAAVLGKLDPQVLTAIDKSVAMMLNDVEKAIGRVHEGAATTAATLRERGDHDGATRVLESVESVANPVVQWKALLELGQDVTRSTRGIQTLSSLLSDAVRDRASPHHVPRQSGAGRAKQTLLDAVLQHLKSGDMRYRAMSELVAGMSDGVTSSSTEARKDRIRKRIRGKDLRTIRPSKD